MVRDGTNFFWTVQLNFSGVGQMKSIIVKFDQEIFGDSDMAGPILLRDLGQSLEVTLGELDL